jgi:hypothetical protein
MAEAQNYTFTHKEIAETLVKRLDIHEGLWGIYVEFSFGAANVHAGPDQQTILPAAIVPIVKIGIQRFDQANSLTVDAAEVNPTTRIARKSRSRTQGILESTENDKKR